VGYSAQEDAYGRAARRVWDGDGYDWQIDATLSFPIGLRADRARYRQSLLSMHREEMRLEQLDQAILVQVRAAVRAVKTNEESVQISSLASELSRRQYESEKARYESGLSTFRRVQESQADWDNAKVNELQARVTLRAALADLRRLEGSSLDRYHIKLAE
jgi:outer membrane protein TolC